RFLAGSVLQLELLNGIRELACWPFPNIRFLCFGGSRPSQNDIWALARARTGLVSIAVEGKVSEPFGPTLSEWLAEGSKGKASRLAFFAAGNEFRIEALAGTDTISAYPSHWLCRQIEAKRFGAPHAVMLVHSFSPSREWFQDFRPLCCYCGPKWQSIGLYHAWNSAPGFIFISGLDMRK
ncbi:MAG: hypothetical protein U5J82_09790, partial [Desulfobacterales bacterium]|nr:hypothetical protein [Desulfobacterales bacterium]